MKTTLYLISLAFLIIGLASCDPDDGKMRTATLTSPNSKDARTFANWGSSSVSVQTFNGVQVIAQNTGTTLLMTCPTDYTLLIQQNVANGSEVLKTCNTTGGCGEAIVVEAGIISGVSGWTSAKQSFNQTDQAGTANNVSSGGDYATGITCVKKADYSKWV
ncbi:hypothetical protein LO80_06165 [Candidatus Francisella endociliophora]|uniref:Lipoprotein n=1 Tax=Candidatus Francisella endociliophora TaxID=653937 RepID=A0A097EPW7_9GAMM|nr:hypothetical protein [Francisella sp. FSC1006]AIT09586.1 hypothetical protein LO80_06165 [Francisella sp. FSC1006]